MKRSFVILLLLLSACGPGGNLVLPGTTGSSLDLPVNTVENWEVVSAKGDKSDISTVKTGPRAFRFTGKFPASFFGQAVDVPLAGTIDYGEDSTAIIRYNAPLNATVKAIYAIKNGGSTIELTTTSASPPLVPIGEKTTLNRKQVTTPGS